jgi:LmbE family N-acetylglucosaminyl deacetylase
MNINILSPHFDDAAYSLGHTISLLVKKNIDVTIINCFTITKWGIVFISKDIYEVSLVRKNEDIEFYKSYNKPINIINLDLLDAPLRSGVIFQENPFSQKEWEAVDHLKKFLENRVSDFLICPLSIGNHIDHAVCLEAVAQLYTGLKVLFFEDLPYANRISESEIKDHIERLENRLDVKLESYIPETISLDFDKEQCIRIYKSQLNDEICGEIMAHLQLLRGERLWAEESLIKELKNTLEEKGF